MKCFRLIAAIFFLTSACSNSSEFEKGEIEALKMLRETIISIGKPKMILDTRSIITREKIDNAKVPVLFIELKNSQNGTLTMFPGQGVGETWLGADGATITLDKGILKATRGMRGDLMGADSYMPDWSEIVNSAQYNRKLTYLNGDNKTFQNNLKCKIEKNRRLTSINVFDHSFLVHRYDETCNDSSKTIENVYFVERNGLVRRSYQYHGPSLEYILIERLEKSSFRTF